MPLIARLFFVSALLWASYLFVVNETLADGEFSTDYQVYYNVGGDGKTIVKQDITLKNNTPNFYADKFELKIGSIKVEDVRAQDSMGALSTTVRFADNISTISVKFNGKVIGQGKSLSWTLTYASSELATKSGQIWEVSIPRVSNNPDISKYQSQVFVPANFGPLAFTAPTPASTNRQGDNQVFVFTKEQLIRSGISMSFGTKQVYKFNLSYFLENDSLTKKIGQITLPPDNNYQQVVIEQIEPKPYDITQDRDGNFVALYKLSTHEQLNVKAQGYVEVFSKPFRSVVPKLTTQDKIRYTQPQRYWETDAASLKEKAKELKTPRQIYDFVTDYLTYDESRLNSNKIERLGAQAALSSPKNAVCMEFTDLFIALARANGIPAREAVGFGYTQNTRLRPLSLTSQGDLLHAWPSYWDDNLGWVYVDPTWGSTSGGLDFFEKLDFNHITFVERGASSIFPLPAGAFKKVGQENRKDVDISFAQELPQIVSSPSLSLSVPEKIIAGIPAKISASVTNLGNTSIFDRKLSLGGNLVKEDSKNFLQINVLPPYSRKEFNLAIQTKHLFERRTDKLILNFDDVQLSKPVTIIPIYFLFFSPVFLASVAFSVFIIVIGLLLYRKTHQRKIPKNLTLE